MFKKQIKKFFCCCRILFERGVSQHHVHVSLDVHDKRDNEREQHQQHSQQQQQQQQRQQQRRCQRQLFERKSPDCEKFESKVSNKMRSGVKSTTLDKKIGNFGGSVLPKKNYNVVLKGSVFKVFSKG